MSKGGENPLKMKNFNIKTLAIAVVTLSVLASCKKENSTAPADTKLSTANGLAVSPVTSTPTAFTEATTKGTIALVSGVYNVRNFHQGTVADLTDTTKWASKASTYYYSIVNSDGGNSSTYDFKFQGSATGDFVVNSAKFDLYYADVAFGSVSGSTSKTALTGGVIGYNTGTTIGWYNYVISNHQVTAVPNRTIILISKTTGGANYKVRINSIYYNAAPAGTPYATNYPFYSLDYQRLL